MSEALAPFLREAYRDALVGALDRGEALVFPSQLAADFWRKHLVLSRAVGVIRDDRIISWDRFKERAFELRTQARPANAMIRTFFASSIVRENAKTPFLQAIVPPEYAHESQAFESRIPRLISRIPNSRILSHVADPPAWLAPILNDLQSIESRYRLFLTEHDLYEPAWLARDPAFVGGSYFLVFPELATDYAEFAGSVASLPSLAVPHEKTVPLTRFSDTQTEMEAAFVQIAQLLDDGVSPEEIVVTVGDLDALRPRLIELAALASVPLTFRQGSSLLESPVGRFFRDLIEASSSGYSLPAMKRLLLAQAIPWRNVADHGRAVERAVQRGLLGSSAGTVEQWLRICEESSSARSLLLAARDAVSAASAGALRRVMLALLGSAVDHERWLPENERVLQRCMQEIRELAELEERLGESIASPGAFLIRRLSESLYVPQRADRGIDVLPYRVGAGMSPEYHFVLNAHARSVAVVDSGFPYLTQAQRDQLGETVADCDLTSIYATAYSLSGAHVAFSYGSRGWEGPHLPPSIFVAAGAIQESDHANHGRAERSPFHSWRAEERLEFDAKQVHSLQMSGLRSYLQAATRPGPDLTRSPIEDGTVTTLASAQMEAEGRTDLLRVSSSALHNYLSCRFGFLLTHILGIDEPEFEVDPDDPRRLGMLYHDLLDAFFASLKSEERPFEAERIDEYRSTFRDIYRRSLERAHGMVPRAGIAAREPLALRVFDAVMRTDSDLIDGQRVRSSEQRDEVVLDEHGVVVVGRFDRVSESRDGLVTLVDYKRRELPRKTDQHGGNAQAIGLLSLEPDARQADRDAITSLQIPFYVLLLESHGFAVENAGYYSLERGVFDLVFGDSDVAKPIMSRERMDEVIDHLHHRIDSLVSDVRGGDYSCTDECDGCPFRGICRSRFVVQ